MLYSADPFSLGIVTPDPIELETDNFPVSPSSETIPQTQATEIFIVDEYVPDFEQLVNGLKSRGSDDQPVQIYTIGSHQSLSDVSDILSQHDNLNTVHIITHGYDANLRIGSSVLSNSTIAEFENDLQVWGESITESGDLLFYGCNLAETADGQALAERIATLTGADVAASDDLTGHSSLGGNWTLEYATGDIALENLLLGDDTEAWEEVLAPITVTTENDIVDALDLSSITSLRDHPGPDGVISLRETIIAANADSDLDTIILPAGNYNLELNAITAGTTEDQYHGDLNVHNSILLQGNGLSDTTIDGGGLDRVFSFTSNAGGINTIENVEIKNGKTTDLGGGGILLNDTTLNLNFVHLHNNQSVGVNGGGIYVDGGVGVININDSFITENTAGVTGLYDQDGGGIHIGAGLLNIERTEFSENKGNLGGSIFSSATLNISDNTLFQNNSANENGGALYVAGLTKIDRTEFESNTARYGGAIAANGELQIEDSWFHLNVAEQTGGAIHNDGLATIAKTLLEENTASVGGGIYTSGATTIINATFTENVAIEDTDDNGGEGGALFNRGTTEIYQSTIVGNSAMKDFGAIGRETGTVTIQSSILEKNNSNGGDDIEMSVISLGFNLTRAAIPNALETDIVEFPGLESTLSDEGGFSRVFALNSDSPAINGGAAVDPNIFTSEQDATGALRNELHDIGAFEYRQTDERGLIFWTDRDERAIYRGDTEGRQQVKILADLDTRLRDIEVDIVNGRIFWVGTTPITNTATLYSAKLDGSDFQTLNTGLFRSTGLALDIENQTIFVTNNANPANGASNDSIEKFDYNGNHLSTVVLIDPLATTYEVKFDPITDTVFWFDSSIDNGGIYSIAESGPPAPVNTVWLAPADDNEFSFPGLSLSPDGSQIYWSDSTKDFIYTSNADGSNQAQITPSTIQQNDGTPATGLDIRFTGVEYQEEGDIVYAISNITGLDIGNERILAVNADGSSATILYDTLDSPHGITAASLTNVSDPAAEISSLETDPLIYDENSTVNLSETLTLTGGSNTLLNSAVITIQGYRLNEDQLDFTDTATITGSLNASSGILTLTGTDTLANYQAALRSITYTNSFEDPDLSQRSFSIIVNGNEVDSTAKTRAIEINAINDVPVITSLETSALAYFSGDGAVALDDTLTLDDVDNDTFTIATVQFTNGYNPSEDILTATNFGSIESVWDPATGTLTFESTSSEQISVFQNALRSTTYENSSTTPDTTDRVLTFTVSDGQDDSILISRVIELHAINNFGSIAYIENAPFEPLVPLLSITGNADLDGGELEIALTTGATTFDRLSISDVSGANQVSVNGTSVLYAGSEHGTITDGITGEAPLVIELNSSATRESVEAILRSVSYMSLSDAPEVSVRWVINVTDGNDDNVMATGTIIITAVNDPPGIDNIGDATTVLAVNDGTLFPLVTGPTASVNDVDSVNFGGGNLAVTGSDFVSGDNLFLDTTGVVNLSDGLTNTSDVTVSGIVIGSLSNVTQTSFTLNFNDNATTARVEEIVNSLAFSSIDTNFGLRSVEVSLTDGDGTENNGSDTSVYNVEINLSQSTPQTISVAEDDAYTFSSSDFEFTGIAASRLDSINITSLPTNGELELGGNIVNLNEQLSKSQIDTGTFTYTPVADANGESYASFNFIANSSNPVVNVVQIIVVDVEPINDDPFNSGTLPTTIVVTEDIPSQVDLSLIEISDVDDQNGLITLTLNTDSGAPLLASAMAGIDDSASMGSALTLTGTIANLNAYLDTPANITYLHNTANLNGTNVDRLSITVNDLGNSGSGGGIDIPLGDVDITINPGNDDPLNAGTLPTTIVVTEDTPSQVDLSLIEISDVDDLNALVTLTLNTDSGAQLLASSMAGIDDSASMGSALTLTGTITDLNAYLDTPANITYLHNTANLNGTNVDRLSITVNDLGNTGSGGGIDIPLGDVDITINPVNDAPKIGSAIHAVIEEDESSPAPQQLGTLLAPVFMDNDSTDNLAGVAMIGNGTSAAGTWEYSTDATTWHSVGSASDVNALVLDSASWIRFIPATNYEGNPPALSLRAIDSSYSGSYTSGANPVSINTQTNGGTTSFSADIATLTASITAVNDAPILSTNTQLPDITEDAAPAGNTIANIFSSNVSDVDASGSFTGIAISNATTPDGDWQYSLNASDWVVIDGATSANALALDTSTHLRFLPSANFNGSPSPLSVHAIDDTYPGLFTTALAEQTVNVLITGDTTSFSDMAQLSLNVTPINDPPFITLPAIQTFDEDTQTPITGISIADVDAASNNLTTRLQVANGILDVTLAGLATISSGNNNSNDLTIQGNLADVNATLASLLYTGDLDVTGTAADTLVVTTNDGGNTGAGGALQDIGSVQIDITAVNDPPLNTVPGTQTIDEDTQTAITGISIADVDAASNNLTTRLQVTNGILDVTPVGAATITPGTSGNSDLTIQGSLADINATLTTLLYTGNMDVTGIAADTLVVTTNDGGNTGSGGPQQDIDNVQIDITAINDAPVNILPAIQTIVEDTQTPITGISIADVDAASNNLTTRLQVTNGILDVTLAGLATISSGNNNSNDLTIQGNLADVNATLASLLYTGNMDVTGIAVDTLVITTNDGGNIGSGGPQQDIDNVQIDIMAVNDPPLNTVPGTQTIDEDTQTAITGISIADVDAASNSLTTRLQVTNGILDVTPVGAATITPGTSGNSDLTIQGSLADINATLTTLLYTGNMDFTGIAADTLVVTTNDGGNTGSGGPQQDIDNVQIDITAINDAPVNILPAIQTIVEDTQTPITGISIADVDAASNNLTTRLQVANGILDVTLAGLATISSGNNNSNDLTIQGSLADINTTLASLLYTGDLDVTGTAADTLVVTTNDGGNTGAGVALQDIGSVQIDITVVNDPPLNTVPGTQTIDEDTQTAITGISIADVDAASNNLTTRLQVANGILDVTLAGLATISSGNNNSSDLTIQGSLADVNATLASLLYTGNMDFTGTDTLDVTTNDTGNTGTGGALTDTDSVQINITAINDAPTGTNITLTTAEDSSLTLSSEAFGFSDSDIGDTLSAVIIDDVTGNGALTIGGVLLSAGQTIDRAAIDAGELIFQPLLNSNGSNHTSIDFRVVDSGDPDTGLNTAVQAATIVFDVTAVNDLPSSIEISNSEIVENTQAGIVGVVSVTDVDTDDSHSLSVDDPRFEIINGQLSLKPDILIDFESEPEIPLSITAIDENGAATTQSFNLLVTDVNEAPVPQSTPEPQTVTPSFTFALPAQTFIDPDGDQLSHAATLENGDPLPAWLVFDPDTLEFTVRPTAMPGDTANVIVTADDGRGMMATTQVQVNLEPEIAPARTIEPEFTAALPPETAPELETVESEPEVETTAENEETAAPPAENFLSSKNLPNQTTNQSEDTPPQAAEIPLPNFTVLGIELIQSTKHIPVTQSAQALLIEINAKAQQQNSENLITQVALNRLANQMDDGKQFLRESATDKTKVLGTSVTMASSLSVGYIFWILRSGTLLASVMTSMPAWKYIDPLPVLDSLGGSDDENDQETLESMVEKDHESDEVTDANEDKSA